MTSKDKVMSFGEASEWPPDDLPSHLQLILDAKLVSKENPSANGFPSALDSKIVVDTIHKKLVVQWSRTTFIHGEHLINEKTVRDNIRDFLTIAKKCENGKANMKERQKVEKLKDELFNLLRCKCKIYECSEFNCIKIGDSNKCMSPPTASNRERSTPHCLRASNRSSALAWDLFPTGLTGTSGLASK